METLIFPPRGSTMNTAWLDEATHIQEALHALNDSPGLWALNLTYGLAMVGTLAQATGVRLKIAALAREIERLKPAAEIDPEDRLTDALLQVQRQAGDLYVRYRGIAARYPALRWYHRAPVSALCWLLRSIHARIGALRVYILEFDADASGRSGQGPFTNVDDLVKSLDA